MLTKDERILLQNVLDCLNRLYDHESTATDVQSLLVATSMALRESELAAPFQAPIQKLHDLIHSHVALEQRRDKAIEITDDLRHFVAGLLHRDAKENPRQRHFRPKFG
jgi:hypothetical protein